MTVAIHRAGRLIALERLLYRAPHGLRVAQISERLEIQPRTVYRDLQALEEIGVPLWQVDGRWGVDRTTYWFPIRLTLDEAVSFYLAGRLLARHSDYYNPHVVKALEKLAAPLPESLTQHIYAAADSVRKRKVSRSYVAALETLARGWAERRRVRMLYRSRSSGEQAERVFEPYFLEPSAVGLSVYAVGFDHLHEEVRVFKVERVRRAELLKEAFTIPKDFDPSPYLEAAWTIAGGAPLVDVVLRFNPEVAERVAESVWHPTQELTRQADGSIVMRVRLPTTLEIKPWILGWGALCEVLAPLSLRNEICDEVVRLAEMYRSMLGSGSEPSRS